MAHYNLAWVDRLCAILNVPAHLDAKQLYNVSFDLQSHAVKLYFLNEDQQSLTKIGANQQVQQCLAEPNTFNTHALFSRLGQTIDLTEIVPDTIEQNQLYLYIEPAEALPFIQFLECFAACHGLTHAQLLQHIQTLNAQPIHNLVEAHTKRAISLARLDLEGQHNGKLYARPWMHGIGHSLNAASRDFLCQLYDCTRAQLNDHLYYAWLSIDVITSRLVVATQRHHLLHEA